MDIWCEYIPKLACIFSVRVAVPCRFDDSTAYGRISGIDDPSMGWARYAQVCACISMDSSVKKFAGFALAIQNFQGFFFEVPVLPVNLMSGFLFFQLRMAPHFTA